MAIDAASAATAALVTRFENSFNTRDFDVVMADMSAEPVFEHVAPAAVSIGRHEGRAAVRAVWEGMESHFPGFEIRVVDVIAQGDRAACQWTMTWKNPDGTEGFCRGADIFTVKGGKIAEKLTYLTL